MKKNASFYCGAGRMLHIASHLPAQTHRHSAIQITFCIDAPFSMWTEETDWFSANAVIIESNIEHALKDLAGKQVTCLITPDAIRGANVRSKLLNGKKITPWPIEDFMPRWQDYLALVENNTSCYEAFELVDRTIDELTGINEFHGVIDARITDTIHHIQHALLDDLSAESLAARVHLSTDRFLHLFKEQMGLPIRQYILFQRNVVATESFINGMPLKQAAYEAGFSDPAHFSRTFSQLYGSNPSDYLKAVPHYNFQFCLPSKG